MLSAEQLLTADELPSKVIHVPEWARDGDDEVMIQVMGAAAMSRYQARLQQAAREGGKEYGKEHIEECMMLQYVAACIVDPQTRQPVFDTPERVEVLAMKDGEGLKRVFEAATVLHLDDEAAAALFEKNSVTPPASAAGGSTRSNTDMDTPTSCSESSD